MRQVRLVDGHGGAARAEDADVGEDPLEAGVGQDVDPVLGLDAVLDERGRALGGDGVHLLPGHVAPGARDLVLGGDLVAPLLDGALEDLVNALGHGRHLCDRAGGPAVSGAPGPPEMGAPGAAIAARAAYDTVRITPDYPATKGP